MSLPKILIVEDDPEIQRAYARELRHRAEVLAATTLEAGERLFREHPDIAGIIMDGNVPGASTTFVLVHEMRKTFKGPIIAASGDEHANNALLRAGCSAVCSKPSPTIALYEALGLKA